MVSPAYAEFARRINATGPLPTPAGTVVRIDVSLHPRRGTPATTRPPPKAVKQRSTSEGWVAPNPVPWISTGSPAHPRSGRIMVITAVADARRSAADAPETLLSAFLM